MSYNKPQLTIYDADLNRTAIIDDYETASWTDSAYSCGQFAFSINFNIPNASRFHLGSRVQFGDDPYRLGIITGISDPIGEDGKGSQLRAVTGYDMRYMFRQRAIMYLNAVDTFSLTGNGETVIKTLVSYQCGNDCTTASRVFPYLRIYTNNNLGSTYTVSEKFTNLLTVLETVALQTSVGWRIAFDATARTLTLECYQGTDRSSTVAISTDTDSVRSGTFQSSTESYTNLAYVGGSGVGDGRTIYAGYNGTEPSGFNRYESYEDASSLTTVGELTTEASSVLRQYAQTETVSATGLAKCPYVYGTDYSTADVVTVSFTGHSVATQILSVTEAWAFGSYDISYEFGKPSASITTQVSGIAQSATQSNSTTDNSTNTNASANPVRVYTMTSSQTMTANDTLYNTLQLAGTLSASTTLTMYLDTTKLYGRKTYHVMMSCTGAGYSVTLTTGISGMTSVTLPTDGAPYVQDVCVDATGNVTTMSLSPTFFQTFHQSSATVEFAMTSSRTMTGAQVKYDAIKLTGALTADATLALYFSATTLVGRKSYHILNECTTANTQQNIVITTNLGTTVSLSVKKSQASYVTDIFVDASGNVLLFAATRASTSDSLKNPLTITNAGYTGAFNGSSAVTLDYSVQNLLTCSTASATQVKAVTALSAPAVGTVYNVVMTNGNTYGSVAGSTTTNVIATGSGMQVQVTYGSATYLFDVKGGGQAVGEGCVVAGDMMELLVTSLPTTSANGTMIYRNCQVIYQGGNSTSGYYTKYRNGKIEQRHKVYTTGTYGTEYSFPIRYIAEPPHIVGIPYQRWDVVLTVYSVTTTKYEFAYSSSQSGYVEWIAIGY